MKNFVKGFLAATIVFALTITGFAISGRASIEVDFNPFTIEVEGENMEVDHFAYNGTTYLPLREVAEIMDVEVDWEDETKTVSIYSFEPRMYSWITFSDIPTVDDRERDREADRKLNSIKIRFNDLFKQLDEIDIVNNPIDSETFLDLQWDRTSIENIFSTSSFNVNYRTPVFNVYKALDNIEKALIESFEREDKGHSSKIERYLNNAKEHVERMMLFGF